MKVINWISKNPPVTISRTALLQEASQLMKKHAIRHLPVVEENELVGFITESDLREFSFPSMIEEIVVHQVMVANPITINVNSSIEEAARLIFENKVGGLPVLNGKGKLVGVITESDILAAFIEVMGLLKKSCRLDIIITKEGGLEEVTRIMEEHNCTVISVATDNRHATTQKVHYFRLEKCNLQPVIKALEAANHKVISVME